MNEDNNNLPEGWIWTNLSSIAKIIMGQSPPSSTYNTHKDGLPFFQGKAEFGELFPEPVKYCVSPKKIAENNDVLISVRAPVGPTNLANNKCCIGRGLAAIRAFDGVQFRLLLYYLRSIESELSEIGQGSTFTAINKNVLYDISIPLPPSAEQERIVQKLENLFSRLKKTKEELARIPPILKKFRRSVLAKTFNGELTKEWREQQKDLEPASVLLEKIRAKRKQTLCTKYKEPEPLDTSNLAELPDGWKWASLGDILESAQPGFACGKKDVPNGLRHLRMNNIDSECNLNLSLVRTVPESSGEEKYLLKKGDVLFCHTNSQKLIGKTALFEIEGKFAFSNHLTRLRFFKNTMKSEWVWHYLSTLWRQGYFENKCKQWVNQATIERDTLINTPMPVPPVLEQAYAIEKIKELFGQADAIAKSIQIAQNHCEKLTQSILAKAFRGELVPQDPNDEPATLLLERIKTTRQQSDASSKPYGRRKR